MPRGRKRVIDAPGSDGANGTTDEGTPTPRRGRKPAGERPGGLTDFVWTTGRILGNVSLAQKLADTDEDQWPANGEATELLAASRKLEDRAMKRYLKLKSTVGKQLEDALVEYRGHRERTGRIVEKVSE